MEQATRTEKLQELERLRGEIARLEQELGRDRSSGEARWQPTEYYGAYYATTGFMLGMFGALTSLMFNVVGAMLIGEPPLKLIRIYLTFGLGETAAQAEFNDYLWLALGCCLYVGTGMLLGMVFQLVLTRFFPDVTFGKRLAVASVLGLAVWIINFYAILSWLQPLLFDGNWIVREIPWYVGAGTHLVFAWTMAVVYPLGLYHPYRLQTEQQ